MQKWLSADRIDGNIFSYALLDHYVVVTVSGKGVYVYDYENKTYAVLEHNEDYSYIYISKSEDGSLYTRVAVDDTGSETVMRIGLAE